MKKYSIVKMSLTYEMCASFSYILPQHTAPSDDVNQVDEDDEYDEEVLRCLHFFIVISSHGASETNAQ